MLPSGSTVRAGHAVLVIPGVITAFSLAVVWAALQLELSPAMIVGDSMQPRVFPILLMVINLVLAALLAIQYRTKPPKKIAAGRLSRLGVRSRSS